MKISIKGYKDNSPDKKEKSLMIPSNTLTMEGVSKPITAIPIINGKPDYTQKVTLKPGDADYTHPEASGFIEIPNAEYGIEIPTAFSNPLFQTNNLGQIIYNGNTFGQGLGDTSLNIPQVNRGLPEGLRTYEAYQKTMGGSPNTMSQADYEKMIEKSNPTYTGETDNQLSSEERLQRMLGLMGSSTSPDLQSSLQTLGWSIGFNPSEFNHLSPQAKKTMSGANTALGVASAGNALLKGAYEVVSAMGAGKRDSEDRISNYEKITNQYKKNSTFFQKLGGQIFQEGGQTKILTEGYTTGLPQGSPLQPNAEVESGEMLKNPQTGQVTEVIGKRHSEGGELMNLEGGTKVISDYLEIGSKLAREFKKEFDLKQLTPKSTFATVVKRFRDKIGLTKKLKELEKVISKIQKQDEVENENTKNLNLQILSEEYNQATQEIEPLQNQLERFTDFIFEHQEYKKAEEKDKERFNKLKKGGVVKVLQEGGQIDENQMMEIVDAFCDMTNQDPNQVIQDLSQMSPEEQQEALQMMVQAIQQGGAQMQQQDPQQMEQGEEMMQDGGEIGEQDVQQLIMMFAQATGANPEEIMQQLQSLPPEEQQQMLQEMAQFLQQQMQGGQEQQMAPEEGGEMMQSGGLLKPIQNDRLGVGVYNNQHLNALRPDGSLKGDGFMNFKSKNGNTISEASVGVNINGKEVDIPTVGPWLSKEEIEYIRNNDGQIGFDKIGDNIVRKSYQNAKKRIDKGMSPFANFFEQAVGKLQEGGESQAGGEEEVMMIIQAFAQATGESAEAIIQQLQQVSPEEQQQMLQQMVQYLQQQEQGGQEQQMAPEEEQMMMQVGGRTQPKTDMSFTGNVKAFKNSFLNFKDSKEGEAFMSLVKLVDPTGVTSYEDVKKAWTDGVFDEKDIIEAIGALPLIGKVSKVSKGIDLAKNGVDLMKANKFLNFLDNTTKVIDKVGVKKLDDLVKGTTKKGLEKVFNPSIHRHVDNINIATRGLNIGNRLADGQDVANKTYGVLKKQDGGEIGGFEQILIAYAQATGQDPQTLAQSLKDLSEEELQAEMEKMVAELQNLQK